MTAAAFIVLAAVSIAFPREGARFGYMEKCYVIGATDGGETNITVNGIGVPVYRTGAWGVLLDVAPGENTVSVGGVERRFRIGSKPAASKADAAAAKKKPEKKYKKLSYAGDAPKPHPGGRPPSEVTIVVDPGHGGDDSGALSPHGRTEKEANLLLSLLVRDELSARGYRVLMTRESDSAVALYDRPKTAHGNDADAFVSIHHNAPPHDRDPTKLRYHCVYGWNDIGKNLAKAVNLRMGEAFGPSMPNNGVMHANFAVTRNPEIPSCLIEVDFITSPQGEEATWDESVRRRTAAAIASGIHDWASSDGGSGEK